jgi:hypothetical protein
MTFKKEYLYFGVIAGLGAFLISRLRQPAPGVVSSLVPVSVGAGTAPDSRDPARLGAFSALAGLAQSQGQQATRMAELSTGLEAEKIRADAQAQALDVQRELGLARLSTSLQQRQMDNQTSLDAIRYMGSQSNQAAMTSGIFGAIAAALRALGGNSQQRAGGGLGGGSAAQPGAIQRAIQRARAGIPTPKIGFMTPPFNPGYLSPNLGDPFQSGDFGSSPGPGFTSLPLSLGSLPILDPIMPNIPGPLPESNYPVVGIPDIGGGAGAGDYYGGDFLPTDDWQWGVG